MHHEHDRTMPLAWAIRTCVLLLPLACSSPAPSAAPDSELGFLEIDLTAPDRTGRRYRLRDAEFVVTPSFVAADGGSMGVVLSSETSLDEERLTERLHPGSYFVELRPGWRMEEVTATPVGVPATLLSAATVFANIRRFSTTFVNYDFGVNGGPLAFGGDLSIGITVTSADAGAP